MITFKKIMFGATLAGVISLAGASDSLKEVQCQELDTYLDENGQWIPCDEPELDFNNNEDSDQEYQDDSEVEYQDEVSEYEVENDESIEENDL